jgi:hypothetical protein
MIRRMAGTPTRSTVYDLIKYRATLHTPRRAEQPSHCRRRCQHQSVTFTYCDYRHGSQLKELTLTALEFIRRFSLHILPPGLVRIRHYGILGNNRRKAAIAAARAIFKRRRRAVELQPLERELKKAFITTAACSLPPPIFRRVLGVKISGSCVSHASG